MAVIAVILETYVNSRGAQQLAGAFGATFWWVFALSAVPLALAFFLPRPQPSSTAVTESEEAAGAIPEI